MCSTSHSNPHRLPGSVYLNRQRNIMYNTVCVCVCMKKSCFLLITLQRFPFLFWLALYFSWKIFTLSIENKFSFIFFWKATNTHTTRKKNFHRKAHIFVLWECENVFSRLFLLQHYCKKNMTNKFQMKII